MTLRSTSRGLGLLVVGAALCLGGAVAQPERSNQPEPSRQPEPSSQPDQPEHLPTISREQFQAQLQHGQELLEACEAKVQACDQAHVSADEQVSGAAGGIFIERWQWLRDTLTAAKTAGGSERAKLFDNARQRLADEAAGAGTERAARATPVEAARTKADAILARGEFRHFEQDSYLWLKLAALGALLDRLFYGAFEMLPTSTAFGAALEWAVLVGAAMALMLYVWRANRQQRVQIATGQAPAQAWQQESEEWAQRAQAEAAAANWREAVHCLYWSAIVMLEGQRLWRQNRARTPREYVALLEPGSARRQALGGLTRVFERIWYGLRPAAEGDFQQAKALVDELRAG